MVIEGKFVLLPNVSGFDLKGIWVNPDLMPDSCELSADNECWGGAYKCNECCGTDYNSQGYPCWRTAELSRERCCLRTSIAPTRRPTATPRQQATMTESPTMLMPLTIPPTSSPTGESTLNPTAADLYGSRVPTLLPSRVPTLHPTLFPTAERDTMAPSAVPTRTPQFGEGTIDDLTGGVRFVLPPTGSIAPTRFPTSTPTVRPSRSPTITPTLRPTQTPSISPTTLSSSGYDRWLIINLNNDVASLDYLAEIRIRFHIYFTLGLLGPTIYDDVYEYLLNGYLVG